MQAFEDKLAALFASLDDAASKEVKGTRLEQTKLTSAADADKLIYRSNGSYRQGNSMTTITGKGTLSYMRGKESIFKRPEAPIGRFLKSRKKPDYQINPHKWRKYSVADIDTSECTNHCAAINFLREIEDQRAAGGVEAPVDPGARIEFKRAASAQRQIRQALVDQDSDAQLDRPQQKSSKLIMPEYVIGLQPARKKKKNHNGVQRAAGTLALAHLQEDDEEQQEDTDEII